MVVVVLMNSLKYRDCAFEEEKEWRIYFKHQIYKKPEWIYGDSSNDSILWDKTSEMIIDVKKLFRLHVPVPRNLANKKTSRIRQQIKISVLSGSFCV